MHILYQAALRWEMVERNPVVRQSSKRLKRPRVLTPAEFKALLAQLKEPYRTMVITVAWGSASPSWWRYSGGDLDTVSLTVQALRGFVRGEINPTKTEASESALHALGTKPAVQKELLRHADIRTTMNVYTQAVSDEKREAASRVVHTLYESVLAGKPLPTVTC